MKIGVHCGPQDSSLADLQRLWRRADQAGFHWVSVWDHFYANPLQDRQNPCFEGVAAMAALAAATTRVRVGCLMFCMLYRNPGVLAKAAVTIDHLSNGRAEIGVGAGWFEEEFREFGYGFPADKDRMDQLEEGLQVMRDLLHRGQTEFKGKYYQFHRAVCSPPPVQKKLRLWIGGRGEHRTPRLAGMYGDGFNIPYLDPQAFADRNQKVDRTCERIQRDPREIERTINLGFYMWADAKGEARMRKEVARFDAVRRTGMLVGNAQQITDRLKEYEQAGAQGVNIAIRPPTDWDVFEAFIEQVLPHFKG